jgi:hypothetical protein
LVLSLTGVLLAAFVPTFARHVHTSKLAEATERLSSLHRHAASYYTAEHGADAHHSRNCLPEAAGPYPLEPSADPVDVDFAADERGAATWLALGQRGTARLRYSYEIIVPEPGCAIRLARPALTFRAYGDLDGDGMRSLLERVSVPGAEALTPQGPLRILSRTE